MALPRTEDMHADASGIDACPEAEALLRLLSAQRRALDAVEPASAAIAAGAAQMAEALRGAGRLVYVGAGSSALMAVADALELPGTFGIDADRILILMAGGMPQGSRMPGDTEDDAAQAAEDARLIRAGDVVIAVTASGNTPHALAIARAARDCGARVIGIANNAGAQIFALADVAICLETPPEVIAGSTRMGAGTAQKAALNLMSTLMGIRLGRVHDGMMVGVVADNRKLRARARGIVARIAGCGEDTAARSLDAAGGAVRSAVLIALGLTPAAAEAALAEADGNLRAALARIEDPDRNSRREGTNQGRE